MIDYGKVPPQDIELEEAVLGIMLVEQAKKEILLGKLNEGCFYKESNRIIFSAIKSMTQKNKPVDILTTTNELRAIGKYEAVGGVATLMKLTNRADSGSMTEYYADILNELAGKRELITSSQQTMNDSFENNLSFPEIVDNTIKGLENIAAKYSQKESKDISDVAQNIVEEIKSIASGEKAPAGIKSSIDKMNLYTHGWQNSDLIIIAARPGMGKTAFVLGEVLSAARNDIPVLFFSLEMSTKQLVQRLIINISGVDNDCVRSGRINSAEMTLIMKAAEEVSMLPIHIIDTTSLSITQARIEAKIMKKKHDIGFVVLDYLQLMGGDERTRRSSGNREQEIAAISRGLKSLAKEINVPVIALSQLSRSCESRVGKRPILSDLRESGSIEQDADIVLFLWRADYYKRDGAAETPMETEGMEEGYTEINIAKHRNGAITTVKALFNEKTMTFRDIETPILKPDYGLLPNSTFEPTRSDEPF